MPSAKRRLRFPTACLSSRHEGRSSVRVAVPYHLLVLRHEGRSFTRATRFASASTPLDERPEPQSGSLPTACLPAQAFGALRSRQPMTRCRPVAFN
jgi:hypothetical protein